jgi:hypothetical protein
MSTASKAISSQRTGCSRRLSVESGKWGAVPVPGWLRLRPQPPPRFVVIEGLTRRDRHDEIGQQRRTERLEDQRDPGEVTQNQQCGNEDARQERPEPGRSGVEKLHP